MTTSNKHSALSGNDNIGELVGNYPERDLKLRQSIHEMLASKTELDINDLKVEVKDNFVSLTGRVKSDADLQTIKSLVEKFPGVEDVAILLEIVKH